jgi:hypothetical protein
MPPEPPPEFVAFVTRWLPRVRAGMAGGDEVYPAALADVASYWRWRGLLRVDPGTVLRRRLATRARRWHEHHQEPAPSGNATEMVVLPERSTAVRLTDRAGPADPVRQPGGGSVALRKAALLPSTARADERPVAEAGIAWLVAYRRHLWGRWARTALTAAALLAAVAQLVPQPPT